MHGAQVSFLLSEVRVSSGDTSGYAVLEYRTFFIGRLPIYNLRAINCLIYSPRGLHHGRKGTLQSLSMFLTFPPSSRSSIFFSAVTSRAPPLSARSRSNAAGLWRAPLLQACRVRSRAAAAGCATRSASRTTWRGTEERPCATSAACCSRPKPSCAATCTTGTA